MKRESKHTEAQIKDVIPEFFVGKNFAKFLIKSSMIAHDTDKMDNFDNHIECTQQPQRGHDSNAKDRAYYAYTDENLTTSFAWPSYY